LHHQQTERQQMKDNTDGLIEINEITKQLTTDLHNQQTERRNVKDKTDDLIEINEITKLLASYHKVDFQSQLERSDGQVTLFIGISGAGKSTIAQFLAGNKKLESKSEPGSYDFYVSDGNETIGESTISSKTWLPELVEIPNRNMHPLLDCPGFLDTRSNIHEIATSVFTKNVLQNVKLVKIAVITSHHAVRKGLDRTYFTSMLTNLADFIKCIDKYENSISLIVNKVDNQPYIDEFNNIALVSDAEMIKQIASFITDVQLELKNSKIPANSTRDRIMEIFLTKTNGQYSNISIMRRPDRAGYLHEIKLLQAQKADIESLIFQRLTYGVCDPNDFGLTLSAEAQFSVFKTEEKMRSEIQAGLNIICETILQRYQFITRPHFSDCFPLLGPKSPFLSEMHQTIRNIDSRNKQNFEITKLFDWFDIVETDETVRIKEKLLETFEEYDFLADIVHIDSNDYEKFFYHFSNLRSNLERMLEFFQMNCFYRSECF
jgi:GTP-binding protein EngB required for normal cell division